MINSDFKYTRKIFYEFAAHGTAFVFDPNDTYDIASDQRIYFMIERIQATIEEYLNSLYRSEEEKWSKLHSEQITYLALYAFGKYSYVSLLKSIRDEHRVSFIELYKMALPRAKKLLHSKVLESIYSQEQIEKTKAYIDDHQEKILRLIEREILREQLEHVSYDTIVVLEKFYPEYLFKLSKHIKGFVIRNAHDKDEIVEFSYAYEIPMIESKKAVITGDKIILDNINEVFKINPPEDEYISYKKEIHKLLFDADDIAEYKMTERKFYASLVDTRYLHLASNKTYYSGLGMFRPEYYFMTKGMLPNVGELIELYSEITDAFIDREIYLFLPDLGELKVLDYLPKVSTFIKEIPTEQNVVFWLFFEAIKTVSLMKNKKYNIVVPMLRSPIEVEEWQERINFVFDDVPEHLKPLIGMNLETESVVDQVEKYAKTDFSFIGLDTLRDETSCEYSRYDFIPLEEMKLTMHHYLQTAHQHLRRTGIRKKHLISGHMMRNEEVFHKLFTMGFKDFVIPVTLMNKLKHELIHYENTRGKFIGVAAERKRKKKQKQNKKK